MKFIHISDLHIGKRLAGYSMIEEQKRVLDQVIDVAFQNRVDGVIIAGDVYDKSVPSEEAIEIFTDFIEKLANHHIKAFVIAGNHDSGIRLQGYKKLIENRGIYLEGEFCGKINKIILEDEHGTINIFLMPYFTVRNVNKFFEDDIKTNEEAVNAVVEGLDFCEDERNILVAHLYMRGSKLSESEEFAIGNLDQVSYDKFKKFDYVALGHIHGKQKVYEDKIRYCGTPIKYSFSEINHTKVMLLVEMGAKGSVDIKEIPFTDNRGMMEIEDSYHNIILNYYSKEEKNSYVRIKLTDELLPFGAYKGLKEVFPYLCSIHYQSGNYDNETNNSNDLTSFEPLDIFKELFYAKMDRDMDDTEETLVKDILNKLKYRENYLENQ